MRRIGKGDLHERNETRDGSDEIGTLVHDNGGICSETGLDIFQRIIVHAGETEAFS